MTVITVQQFCNHAVSAGAISDEDLLVLKREVLPDGLMTREDADLLIALERAVTGVSLAALLLGFLLPGSRRRRPVLFALLASVVMFGALGCTHISNPGTTASGLSGTPEGTQVIQITASGTDGKTTTVRPLSVQVNVQ